MTFWPLLALLALSSLGSILSSSTLEHCKQQSTSQDLNCEDKLVLLLSIEGNQVSQLLSNQCAAAGLLVNLTFSETSHKYDFRGKCATQSNYVYLNRKVSPFLLVPRHLPKSKFYRPFILMKDFPYYAYEEVILTSKYACKDNLSEEQPTCGWQYSNTGQQVPNSQGFCCSCSLINLQSDDTRGNSCSTINIGTGSSSAHCLRFSDPSLDFAAYAVGSPSLNYNLTIQLAVPNTDGSYGIEQAMVSNVKPRAVTSNAMLAEVIGDFAPA